MKQRAREWLEEIRRRRTVRHFSDRTVPREVIEDCVRAAATAPSGANKQPWHFAIVSDPAVKSRIREGAEAEEREFYGRRAPEEWLEALEPFETDANKPFLEVAPYLIVIFAQLSGRAEDGSKIKHYYVKESVGIATGFLIAALHHAGLACLTHTPSPMRFLNDILARPANETPFLVLVVGYPEEGARVPDIGKKRFEEIATSFEDRGRSADSKPGEADEVAEGRGRSLER
ncbi:MAG TPA: nitroreductase family protein [Thermoanaerobaculia bacterium]|nr:nitroreductase family protein [Thermoanaerobaculia bacterium]